MTSLPNDSDRQAPPTTSMSTDAGHGEATRPDDGITARTTSPSAEPDPDRTRYRAHAPAVHQDHTIATPHADDADKTVYEPQEAVAERPIGPGRFGNYELLDVISRGGMGIVFKARQLFPERLVALKMIGSAFASPEELERFRREAQAAGELNHPCIVKVYDVGDVEGQPYYTMELVPSGSLQQAIEKHGSLDPLEAVRVLRQIADAVQCAHASEKQIIHRDIKPQNILLRQTVNVLAEGGGEEKESASGSSAPTWPTITPMLTDFGLARAKAQGSGLTKPGQMMGTPSYMSPEQARGKLDEIGPASDVYSLGAVLYCMLTGRPPFQSAEPNETVRQVCEDEPTPPRRLNRRTPRDLETICLKCLAKEPGQRYATVAALAEDLDCVLNDHPLKHARRAGPMRRAMGRLVRSLQRRPLRTAYLALSLIAFVLLGVLAVNTIQDRQRVLAELDVRAEEKVRLASQAEAEGDRNEALQHYAEARRLLQELLDRSGDQSAVRVRLADVLTRRGIQSMRKWDYQEAEEDFKRALEHLESLPATLLEEQSTQRQLAEVHHNRGVLNRNQASDEHQWEALRAYQEALKLRERLCRLDEHNLDYLRDLARNYGYMGDTELALGLEANALKSYEASLRLREQIVLEDGQNVEARYQLARGQDNFGRYYEWQGRVEDALAQFRQVKQDLDNLAQIGVPAEFLTDQAHSYTSLARLQLDVPTQRSESRELLEGALATYRDLIARTSSTGPEGKAVPAVQDRSRDSAVAQINVLLGKYYCLTGNARRARDHLREAVEGPHPFPFERPPPEDLYHQALREALLVQLKNKGGPLDQDDEDRIAQLLNRALNAGYRDVARLERDVGFEPFRTTVRFQQIVQNIKAKRAEAVAKYQQQHNASPQPE